MLPHERPFDIVRYEVALELSDSESEVHIVDEKVVLRPMVSLTPRQRTLFPLPPEPPPTIITGRAQRNERRVVTKVREGNDNYYSEVHERGGKGWAPSIRLGPTKSALGNLPADENNFPVSTWLRDVLRDGIQQIMLNSLALRKISPPGQGLSFKPDGSNLPWVVHNLRNENRERHPGMGVPRSDSFTRPARY